MIQYYTDEKNVQILIALLKSHGLKKIVVSPGSTNVTFVASLQQDSFFEMYSSVDERSAAYIACGLAAESGEPVVLSCTGATASRNYLPGLTESYYRKLPILAVTSTQDESKIGHLIPQIIDRSNLQKDIAKCSVHLQTVKDKNDEWDCIIKANKAILALSHHGKGPVHINLTTTYSNNYSIKELPLIQKIQRISVTDKFPNLLKGKIAIFMGSHSRWSSSQVELIDKFCLFHNAVVFVDPTSNYTGKYRINYNLVALQSIVDENRNPDLLIHIGEMSDMASVVGQPKTVWRVSEDGEIKDRYGVLSNVFEMTEEYFFNYYTQRGTPADDSYLKSCLNTCERINLKLPELPFSHLWVASKMHNKFPDKSVVHFGILSPLRSWSYFPFNSFSDIECYCNQGGFGIDGNMSSLLGASLFNKDKLYFGIVGDLSFFYDMNVLGNRHIGNNVRILLINNSLGVEFHLSKQKNCTCVNDIERYISAGGHYANKSENLVRDYAENLGFEYLRASNKKEFEDIYLEFVTNNRKNKPMIFEVFTNVVDEDEALKSLYNIEFDPKNRLKKIVKNIIGEKSINLIKNIITDK